VTATRIEEEPASDGADLLRSGDPGSGDGESLGQKLNEAGQFGATWGAHIPMPGPDSRG
jgi:hypothetical protein